MGKFAAFLDKAFGFQGSKTPQTLAAGIANQPVLQRDEGPASAVSGSRVFGPYPIQGPGKEPSAAPPTRDLAKPQPKVTKAIAKNDTDLLGYFRARASFFAAQLSGGERTANITSDLEGIQTPTNWVPLSAQESSVANLKIIPSMGVSDILDSRDDILQGINRRTVQGKKIQPGNTWQELLQQAGYVGNKPVVEAVPPGKVVGDSQVPDRMMLAQGEGPKTFYPDESALADKGKGVVLQGGNDYPPDATDIAGNLTDY